MRSYFLIVLSLTACATTPGRYEHGIDREAILEAIRIEVPKLKACYVKGLETQKDLHGDIRVSWEIGAESKILKVEILKSNLNNKDVEDCILKEAKTYKFPEPVKGQTYEVNFPFVFTAKE